MVPSAIVSGMSGSVRCASGQGRRMGQPHYRVAADLAIALPNVGPVDVLFQPQKDSQSALVCTEGQQNFVTFMECRTDRLIVHHVWLTPSSGSCLTRILRAELGL